jgi:hypothetical protein
LVFHSEIITPVRNNLMFIPGITALMKYQPMFGTDSLPIVNVVPHHQAYPMYLKNMMANCARNVIANKRRRVVCFINVKKA